LCRFIFLRATRRAEGWLPSEVEHALRTSVAGTRITRARHPKIETYGIKRGLCPLAHVHPPVKHFSSLHLSCLYYFLLLLIASRCAGRHGRRLDEMGLPDYSKCILAAFTCITYATLIITQAWIGSHASYEKSHVRFGIELFEIDLFYKLYNWYTVLGIYCHTHYIWKKLDLIDSLKNCIFMLWIN